MCICWCYNNYNSQHSSQKLSITNLLSCTMIRPTRISSGGSLKILMVSSLVYQPSVQWVPGFVSGREAAGAWRRTPTPSSVEVKERQELYVCSPSGPCGLFYREHYLYSSLHVRRRKIKAHFGNATKNYLEFV